MWPVAASGIGEVVAAQLANPELLVDIRERIAAVCVAEGCDAIAGASPIGDRIAGAVAAAHSLRIFDDSIPSQRVLVVDGVLATGAALFLAIEEIHRAGAKETRAAVVLDLGMSGSRAGEHRVVEA